jgi:hypothetical protein
MTVGCFAGLVGWDCSISWLIMIVIFFAMAIFRKNIAEDLMGGSFSLLFSTIVGEIAFIISLYLFDNFKFPFIISLIFGIAGGFILTGLDPFSEVE